MTIKICENNDKEKVLMSDVYCEQLIEIAKDDKRIIAMDADLINSIGMKPFRSEFPDRMINCGIQEANMIGTAAGMSITGIIPYVHTFATFATRRAYDQVFISGAFNRANVKIVGSDPGITAAYNGGTHMPFEDIGIMRNIPKMTIIEPTDSVMLKDIIKQIRDIYGMHYIRLVRKISYKVFKEGSTFKIGKAANIREGNDVTIIATGYCVVEAIKAAKILAEEGISARVLNMFTIKPIDIESIVKAAKETGAIVTAENHNIINGLGSAVAEVLAEKSPVPLERIGIQDEFGEVGDIDYLAERYELKAKHIITKVKKALNRKTIV
jgi:transketolase